MFSGNTSQVSADQLYVEDVFSTWLYTGGVFDPLTITNGIDLSGKGGLVWIKNRGNANSHILCDTARGVSRALVTNTTAAEAVSAGAYVTSFNSNGFALGGTSIAYNGAYNYASWTFREAPKFFDVVTYTGNGGASNAIAHNLGVRPGFMIIKRTDTSANWVAIAMRAGATTYDYLYLNTTGASLGATGATDYYASTTNFDAAHFISGGVTTAETNASGGTYVAYLFAHDTTSDGVIQCGVLNAAGEVNLGWEPQWILHKPHTTAGTNWRIFDNMRGMPVGGNEAVLAPNTADAESSSLDFLSPTATGFDYKLSTPAIYIAIRRGPMKTPTLGTSVFAPILSTRAAGGANTTGFPVDMQILGDTSQVDSNNWTVVDRLRKVSTTSSDNSSPGLKTTSPGAETTGNASKNWSSTGFETPFFFPSVPAIYYSFRRAPGFFDEVCYTGTGATPTVIGHNLKVVPEMMIIKSRTSNENWMVYHAALGNTSAMILTTSAVLTGLSTWNSTTPSATTFTLGGGSNNGSQNGQNYVAYLFASCPGVSKVGSYTGNGSSQTINCGFAAGARFVLIKRTDNTGDWYVWDTARGIVAGNDPHLSLNTTAAEVTTNDTIDTDSSGFVVNQVAATNVNVSSATYIYLAIA